MASVTLSVTEELKLELKAHSWVNWSEIAKQESNKKRIFEVFLKTRKLPPDDQQFCDEIDWHPVDELPLKEEFVKKLMSSAKKPSGKPMTTEAFKKWCDSL